MTRAVPAAGPVKIVGSTRELDRLDLAVHSGDVHESLGSNAAGKSIRVGLGLLRRDSITATVLAHGGLDRTRSAPLPDRLQLGPAKQSRVHSKGNRQKLALVAAFASDAELLLIVAALAVAGPATFRRRDLALPA